jgi:hypothetical protein
MKKLSLFLFTSIFCVSSYGQLFFNGISVEGKPSDLRKKFESKKIKLKEVSHDGNLIYETIFYGKNITLTAKSDGDKDKGEFILRTEKFSNVTDVYNLYDYFKNKLSDHYGDPEEIENHLRENEKNKNSVMYRVGADLKSCQWIFENYGITMLIEEDGSIKIYLCNWKHANVIEEGYTDPKDI